MEKITSKKNQQLKELTSLKMKKHRYRRQQFILEGILLVEEALNAGLTINKIFLCPSLLTERAREELVNRLLEEAILLYEVEASLFKELSDTVSPQGILAIAEMPPSPKDLSQIKRLLVIDGAQDPGNVGTMIRTAAGVGCDGLIFMQGAVDPYSLKVLRGSMGALFHIPLLFFQERKEAILFLKERGCAIVVADSRGEPFYSLSYREPVALVVGNEAKGVDEIFLQEADTVAALPLEGGIDSLNVSLAAGIILYEIYRQNQQER